MASDARAPSSWIRQAPCRLIYAVLAPRWRTGCRSLAPPLHGRAGGSPAAPARRSARRRFTHRQSMTRHRDRSFYSWRCVNLLTNCVGASVLCHLGAFVRLYGRIALRCATLMVMPSSLPTSSLQGNHLRRWLFNACCKEWPILFHDFGLLLGCRARTQNRNETKRSVVQ